LQAQDSPQDSAAGVPLGEAIREARQRRHMSQEALALESGLRRKTISLLERGQTDPRLGTLRRIAGAVGVPLVDLIARSGVEQR
jgi:transcriptional regulator with XRE-family HTH domain